MTIAGEKEALRAEMKRALSAMDDDERASCSARVCERLAAMDGFASLRTVLMYAAIPGEVDLDPLMALLLGRGVRVCVPRVDWAAGTMVPALVSNLDEDLVAGRYSVRSPGGWCPEIALSEPEMVLVPGLAFDRSGGRLGRGAGFYDRLLGGGVGCPVVGVCFAHQIIGRVPREAHDRAMDRVVCEECEMRREHG
ncbi:MAG: 5-formyltetrahydrofolate cyclo-ligase [Phycisphaerales bacterium]|nr:5-formyltetrahydrofolate cyclo-ligase [Phycisphaerales bacterium]